MLSRQAPTEMSRMLRTAHVALQGWYWPQIGPQNTLYVPGPTLMACNNVLTLLEVGTTLAANASMTGARSPRTSEACWPTSHNTAALATRDGRHVYT